MAVVKLPDERHPDIKANFVKRLTASQNRLFAYVYSVTHDAEIAAEADRRLQLSGGRLVGDDSSTREAAAAE